jgi:RNA polymerase-binding transcription factor DksA
MCRVTGRLLDKARLRAVPHATLSLEAKLGYVKNTNDQ